LTTSASNTAIPADAPIPVFVPYLGPEVHQAASDALTAGWLGMGPLTQRFEQEIGAFLGLGDRHVVSTNSCTAALHLAGLAAGLGPGDEVVCPSFTYVAGHQAMTQTGADVVFCDIEPETLGVDPASMREMIGERTKALMAVHYAGIPCHIDEIHALAEEFGLRVIEDAAHAFGSRSDGRLIGSFGDLVCFSYGPVKIITTLEGGAVITPRESEIQPMHEWRLIGVDNDTAARYSRGRAWEYDVTRQGYRYHLGSIPSAIGLSQLAMIDTFIANRQDYCRRYSEALADLPDVILPATDFTDLSMFIYFIRVADAEIRSELMAHMKAQGVATGIHFQGAHEFTFYKDCRASDLSVTEQIAQQQITIPLHSFMDDRTIDRVIESIRSFF
jgi:dTDP-4-amino-4,6-dideoxygalactose transaminase